MMLFHWGRGKVSSGM
jgi:hypothetical protein